MMRWRRTALIILSFLLIAAAGCGPQLSKEQRESRQQGIPSTDGYDADRKKSEELNGKPSGSRSGYNADPQSLRIQSAPEELLLPLKTIGGTDYLIGTDLARAVGYNYRWDEERSVFQLGDYDASYELTVNSPEALKDEEKLTLDRPPVLHNSQVHIPVSALSALFSDDFGYEIREKTCVVRASNVTVSGAVDGPDEPVTGAELDFADDPADPFKGDEGPAPPEAPTGLSLEEEPSMPVLKHMDLNDVIRRAKRYLSVPYAFAAPPYPSSGGFDSSQFTRYVLSKYNVGLNRTARAQSKQGTEISRQSLRKGDLLFFYVPGRYRSNQTVGHVGIYMGNQRMIHASPVPKNGVQITNINNAYWKQTFLSARRVAY